MYNSKELILHKCEDGMLLGIIKVKSLSHSYSMFNFHFSYMFLFFEPSFVKRDRKNCSLNHDNIL